jgi:hypothetical protein
MHDTAENRRVHNHRMWGGPNNPIKTNDQKNPQKKGTEKPKIITVLQQKPYTQRDTYYKLSTFTSDVYNFTL